MIPEMKRHGFGIMLNGVRIRVVLAPFQPEKHLRAMAALLGQLFRRDEITSVVEVFES